MKLPNLPKRKPNPTKAQSSAAKSGSSVRVPRVAEDLYRDMRDRRLLLPALLLVVAIIAVPVALKSPKEAPPQAAAFVAPEGSEQVAPAVLTEQPIGVRDYRERLDELKSRNPFAGDFAFPEEKSAPADMAPVDVRVTPPPSTDVGGPSGGGDTTGPTSPSTQSSPPADTGGTANEVLILAPRIDINAGRVGQRKKITDVEIGDLVPNRKHAPVAMFLGATTNLKYANFLVSDDVTETSGAGRCRPAANQCEFLRLKVDQKRYFTFGPDEARYSIKVTEIREEIVDRRKVK
jgi:hypothetical protein